MEEILVNGSVGKPQSRVEVKIDNSNGEILMRGPFLMDGYYKRKELTDETLRGDGFILEIKGLLMRIITFILQEELLIVLKPQKASILSL